MRGDTGSATVVSERMSCRGWAEGLGTGGLYRLPVPSFLLLSSTVAI